MGGEAVAFRGVGAGEGSGIVARCLHTAPHRRHTLGVREHSDVHGPGGVNLLEGGVSYEGHKAGLMLAPGTGGARGGRLRATVRGVRRLRDVGEAQALSVALHWIGQLSGRALGSVHINVAGLTGKVCIWGRTSQGIWDSMGLTHLRGLKRSTSIKGRPRAVPQRIRPRSTLVTRVGFPEAAHVAPRQEQFGLRATRRGGGGGSAGHPGGSPGLGGRTQVKERSTHARPGMHMQQCSAVLTAMPSTSVIQAHCALVGRVLAATTSG